MKKITTLIVLAFTFITQGYSQQVNDGQARNGFNFTRFTSDRGSVTHELETLTSKEFKNHPEFGVLPYNAPCKDCIELLQKRDENHRYFVENGTNGKVFYAQTAYSALNFQDATGALRTIDSRLKPTA